MRRSPYLLVILFVIAAALHAQTGIPRMFNYQGVLTTATGDAVPNGSYLITIRLYDVAEGGEALWVETQSVSTLNGVFDLMMGVKTPLKLQFDRHYWLSVEMEGEGEMSPRTKLVAVPYALNAARAEVADSVTKELKGYVRSVNNEDGHITIEGGGMTSIVQNGKTFTITTPPSFQNIVSTDGSIRVVIGDDLTVDLAVRSVDPELITQAGAQSGDALVWDGIQGKWVPRSVTVDLGNVMRKGDAAGGDLTGTYPDPSIREGAVTTPKLATGAVTTEKLADDAVTTPKIANDAVTTAKVRDSAISSQKMSPMPLAPGAYGSNLSVPRITVDQAGRIVTVESVEISITESNGPAGGDLTGTYPNPELRQTGVVAGTYGTEIAVGRFTVDAKGRIVAAENVLIRPSARSSSDLTMDGTIDDVDLQIKPSTVGSEELVDVPGLPTTAQGSGLMAPVITVDRDGRLSSLTQTPIIAMRPGDAAGGDLMGTYPNPLINVSNAGTTIITAINNNTTMVIDGSRIEDPAVVAPSDIGVTGKLDAMDLQIRPNTVGSTELSNLHLGPVGPIGSGTLIPVLMFDADGRMTNWSTTPLLAIKPGDPAGGDLTGTYPNPQINFSTAGNTIINAINNSNTTQLIDGSRIEDPQAVANADVSIVGKLDAMDIQIKAGRVGGAELENLSGLPVAQQGSNVHIPLITVDENGRVIALSATPINAIKPGDPAGGDLMGTYPNPQINFGGAGTNIINAINNTTNMWIDGSRIEDPNTIGASDITVTGKLDAMNLQLKANTVGTDELVDLHVTQIGPLGSGTQVPVITVDRDGRVVSLNTTPITGAAPTGAAGGDLTGTYPNPTLKLSGVGAGSYGDRYNVGRFTVDEKGRLTNAVNVPIELTAASASDVAANGTVLGLDMQLKANTVGSAELVNIPGLPYGPRGGGLSSVIISVDEDGRVTQLSETPIEALRPGDAAGGDLYGSYPNPTINTLTAGENIIHAINNYPGTLVIDGSHIEAPTAAPASDITVTGTFDNMDLQVKTGRIGSAELADLHATAIGPKGTGMLIPIVTIDKDGRVTALTETPIIGAPPSGPAGGDLTGTYPNPTVALGAGEHVSLAINASATTRIAATKIVAADDDASSDAFVSGNINAMVLDLKPNTVGTTELVNTLVVPNSYGSATQVPTFTVDADGRLTAAANVTITGTTPGGAAGGDLTGTYPNPTLTTTSVTAGSYGSNYQVGRFTVDGKGRLTNAENVTIVPVALAASDLSVSGDINTMVLDIKADKVGPIELAPTAVAPNTYGTATQVPQFTVDQEGRLTFAQNVTISGTAPGGAAGGDLTGTYPNPTLVTTGVLSGSYGTATAVPRINVDTKGRILSVTEQTIVTDEVVASDALVSGNVNAMDVQLKTGVVGTTELANMFTPTPPPTAGSVNTVPVITVDIDGRVTALTEVAISGTAPGGAAGGDLTGSYPNPTLVTTGVLSGTYGTATVVPRINVDAKGRILSVSEQTIVTGADASSDALVSGNVNAMDVQLKADVVGPNELVPTAVAPNTYGTATQVPQFTVDQEGRLTFAQNVTIAGTTPGGTAGGDLTGTYPNPTLVTTGVSSGLYGTATAVPRINVDAKGRILSVSEQTIVAGADASSDALVSGNVNAMNVQLKADVVGPNELAPTAVAPNTYGTATQIPQFTVDQEGRLTFAQNITIAGTTPGGTAGGDLTGTYPNPTIASTAGQNIVLAVNASATTRVDAAKVEATGAGVGSEIAVSGDVDAMVMTLNNDVVGTDELVNLHLNPITAGDANNVPVVSIDVDGRVTALTTTAINAIKPGDAAGGDLDGTYPNPTIAKIRGRALAVSTPNDGDVITYDAASNTWKSLPVNATISGAAGGDLSGTYPNPTVAKIQGDSVKAGMTLAHNDVLTWDATNGWWTNTEKGDIPTGVFLREGTAIDVNATQVGDHIHNLNIPNAGFVRLYNANDVTHITGFDNGEDGRLLLVFNGSGKQLKMEQNSALSLEENRLELLITGNELAVGVNAIMMFIYVESLQRWVLVSVND